MQAQVASASNELDDGDLLGEVFGGARGRAIAARLLDRYGGLHSLARAEPAILVAEDGVTWPQARRLIAVIELGRRALRIPLAGERVIGSPGDAARAFLPGMVGLDVEELHAIYVDRRHRLLAVRRLTRGSDQFTVVDPRQVFRHALALQAAAVVIAHNHPSGDPTPSAADEEVTRRVAAAGQVLGVPLLDHLVIVDGGWRSFAEMGVLGSWPALPPLYTRA